MVGLCLTALFPMRGSRVGKMSFLYLPKLPKTSCILWFPALSLPLGSSESDGEELVCHL